LFSPDSQMLFQVGNDTLRVYRVGEPKTYRTQPIGTDFAFSPDMSQVAYTVCLNRSGSRCQSSYAKIYALSDETIHTYTSDLAPTLQSVAFSPDGAALAAASGSGVVIWNVADSTIRFSQRLSDSNQPVDWVKFSPSGDLLLAYESGQRLHFWDLSSGELVYTIPDIRIDRLTWAQDGSFLAILSAGQVSLWGISP